MLMNLMIHHLLNDLPAAPVHDPSPSSHNVGHLEADLGAMLDQFGSVGEIIQSVAELSVAGL